MEIKTAEELMRARYNAYVTGDIEFIKNTHDPDNMSGIDWAESENGLENQNGWDLKL